MKNNHKRALIKEITLKTLQSIKPIVSIWKQLTSPDLCRQYKIVGPITEDEMASNAACIEPDNELAPIKQYEHEEAAQSNSQVTAEKTFSKIRIGRSRRKYLRERKTLFA
jgi:hypothetical protein